MYIWTVRGKRCAALRMVSRRVGLTLNGDFSNLCGLTVKRKNLETRATHCSDRRAAAAVVRLYLVSWNVHPFY